MNDLRPDTAWLTTFYDAWSLGADAATVMWLRTALLAGGGVAAQKEATRMFSEKLSANVELGTMILTGGLGNDPRVAADHTIAHYGPTVRANRARLSRRK
ncbi:hypothetical protein G7A66_05835 [Altererythrobacter sp. SALINAS58]|uniref:hypothetical protein n=1 Tax=Alteripontixanthobacter muriae TaxID=2705546 RepID=UPI00157669F3|nr:hypothetical protein [Alteripontixanthobacter muriae]NTZ42612.1 hypothetical protein [Alteripontixanthobacter muriae]